MLKMFALLFFNDCGIFLTLKMHVFMGMWQFVAIFDFLLKVGSNYDSTKRFNVFKKSNNLFLPHIATQLPQECIFYYQSINLHITNVRIFSLNFVILY